MANRRAFVKKIGTLAALGLVAKAQAKMPLSLLPQSSGLNDLDYWTLVQQSFHLDPDLTYFNNGTMGPSPAVVEQAVIDKIKSVNSDMRYGGGEEVRDSIGKMINAQGSEISLTHNTTEGLNVAAWGLPLKKGDEVLITSQEHVGNAMPWINRAHIQGISIKTFHPANTETEILNQIEGLISKKTRVISVPHISCTIGQRFPVAQICQLARDKGIFSVIDGAHGAGALKLDMQAMQADVYVSCGHKWMLGPKGTGFVYVPERMFGDLKPIFAGAYTDNGFDITVSPPTFNGYSATAHRYDYGTQNAALRIGLQAAVDFYNQIGPDNIEHRIIELNEYLYAGLMDLQSIEMLSSSEASSRSMMLGFRHKKLDFNSLAAKLMQADGHYRIRQVPESGLNSIRVSTHIYNDFEQIDGFLALMKSLD